MKEKTPGRTRPEMGTPEYEEWRKEVLKRRRKRQLKERRKRLVIITVAMIVAVGASVGVGALKGRSEKASKEKMVSSDKQKRTDCFRRKKLQKQVLKNTETASKDTLAEAELLASQYNYDKAIDLLKKAPSYDSDKKMQAAAKKYEDVKATCTAWPLEKVTHVFYHILIKDPSKAFDGDYKEADYISHDNH